MWKMSFTFALSDNSVYFQEGALGGYHCQCPPGFVGTHCEIQRNKCASNPCQNGGRCHVVLDSFVCECISDFAGMLCEVSIRSRCLNWVRVAYEACRIAVCLRCAPNVTYTSFCACYIHKCVYNSEKPNKLHMILKFVIIFSNYLKNIWYIYDVYRNKYSYWMCGMQKKVWLYFSYRWALMQGRSVLLFQHR